MRKIIHIDMDCFYAAVEMRENPRLKGFPVAVGGRPETRGVVATCNYPAREYGIHSAMPMAQAIKKCPNLTILPVNMNLYRQVSKKIQALFKHYTHLVQPLSLDEAYLDVSDCQQCNGSATLIAKKIRQQIWQEQQLSASAGIAPNKFLAKIASDWNKPNGQFVITPQRVDDFVLQLPVKKIFGVGKVTNAKMQKLSINSCADLQKLSQIQLQEHFGKFGKQLYYLARGIDEREVITQSLRKSLSIEDTFIKDRLTLNACRAEIDKLYKNLAYRLSKNLKTNSLPVKALYIKVKFNNFKTTTAQKQAHKIDKQIYQELLETAWQRGKRPVRLIGIGVQFLTKNKNSAQMELGI